MGNGVIFTKNGSIVGLNRTFKATPDYTAPTQFQIGIGTTTPALTDTALANKVPITGMEIADDCEATTGWTGSADATISLNNTTYKVGSGSLSVRKSGTSTVNANMSKTTTSLNFTSKDLSIWVYVADAPTLAKFKTAGAFTIRFGSDSSNYYQWAKAASYFSVGWNLVNNLTSANADSTTGSPSITACDYTFVQFSTNSSSDTWATDKVLVDDIKLASSGDYFKTQATGYPVLTESELLSETRFLILTTDANGNPICEFGWFNTDTSPVMVSRGVFNLINKTPSVQITITEKDQFVP